MTPDTDYDMTVDAEGSGSRHARYQRRRRLRLAEAVETVGGVQVSTHVDCPHGTRDGYDLYKCRCAKCSEHSAAPRMKDSREQRYQSAAEAVLAKHQVPEHVPDWNNKELAAALVEVWRRHRGQVRITRLASHLVIRMSAMSVTGWSDQRATEVAAELTTALRVAGGSIKAEDLTEQA